MGQAKARGTLADRMVQAQAKIARREEMCRLVDEDRSPLESWTPEDVSSPYFGKKGTPASALGLAAIMAFAGGLPTPKKRR